MTSSLTYVASVMLDGLPIIIAQMNHQIYRVKVPVVIEGSEIYQYLDASRPRI